MQAIFSSKLYRASKNKNKIRAALNDPLNVELVKQLKSYLDEDSLEDIDNDIDRSEDIEVSEPVEPSDVKDSEPEKSNSNPSMHRSSAPKPEKHLSDKLEDVEKNPEISDMDSDKFESNKDSGEEDSATKQESAPTATSENEVAEAVKLDIDDVPSDSDVLNILNSYDNTAGVSRVKTNSKNELWIYYSDKTNLNDVMESVISRLDRFECLDFNRLARTENAIVFQKV